MLTLHPAALLLLDEGARPELPRYFVSSHTLRACFDIPLAPEDDVHPPHDLFVVDLLDAGQDLGVAGLWSTHRIVVDTQSEPWIAAVERTMYLDNPQRSERVVFGIAFGPNRPDPIVNFEQAYKDEIPVPEEDAVWLVSFVRRFCIGLEHGAVRCTPAKSTLSRPVRRALGELVGENLVASVIAPDERVARTPKPRLITPRAYHQTPWRDAALGPYTRAREKLCGGLLSSAS
jgi:hypothetical protein